jgi:predicted O-methyltransferase YrrM
MSWFSEQREIPSSENGRIVCRRLFGRWEVFVGTAHESSAYTDAMWQDALRRIPRYAKVKNVLLLGLARGGLLAPLHAKFPDCRVTAVEWDPAMVEVFRTIGPKLKHPPEIIVGDATQVVRDLPSQFDLIIVDLFTGPEVGSPVKNPAFFADLQRLLAPNGLVLANFYRQGELAGNFAPALESLSSWTWKFNALALARVALPNEYHSWRQDPSFVEREVRTRTGWAVVGSREMLGLRWHFGPIWFERYIGGQEPALEKDGPRRLVIWQTLKRQAVPSGWRESTLVSHSRLTGFAVLDANYRERWTAHARRHLKQWHGQKDWEIIEPSLEEFLAAYDRSPMRRGLKAMFRGLLQQKASAHGERVWLFAARKKISGAPIEAGFACLDLPETSQSVHLLSFVGGAAEDVSAGTGLVDWWFRHGLAQGFKFMDFDLFWAPGDSPSWRGFSRFKSQFGVTFIQYPPPLVKNVGTWQKAL